MTARTLDFTGSSTASTDILLIEDNEGDARLTKELLQEARSSRFSVEHVTTASAEPSAAWDRPAMPSRSWI